MTRNTQDVEYYMSEAGLQKFANRVKECLLFALDKEGFLGDTHPEKLAAEYAIVVHRPGFLGKIIEKIRGNEEYALGIKVVKII